VSNNSSSSTHTCAVTLRSPLACMCVPQRLFVCVVVVLTPSSIPSIYYVCFFSFFSYISIVHTHSLARSSRCIEAEVKINEGGFHFSFHSVPYFFFLLPLGRLYSCHASMTENNVFFVSFLSLSLSLALLLLLLCRGHTPHATNERERKRERERERGLREEEEENRVQRW
jgi:hypothetical protein